MTYSAKGLFIFLLFVTFFSRAFYLGYNPLGHGEAENGEVLAFVMPYLSQYDLVTALWETWHLFINGNNPLAQVLAINVPLSWVPGINELTLRANALFGGFSSAIIVFHLVKRHSNYALALIALALFSFNPYLIAFQRFGYVDSLQIACILGGVMLVDIFREKRTLQHLFYASILFCISILLKANAIIFIPMFLVLYCYFYKLKLRDLFLSLFLSFVILHLLFADQLGLLYASMLKQVSYSTAGSEFRLQLGTPALIVNTLLDKVSGVFYFSENWWCEGSCGFRINARWHLEYVELTIVPLIISILFWRTIHNKFFRLATVSSVLYFLLLLVQGRYFYRYLQIGMITTTMAFAFPLHYIFQKYRFPLGAALLISFISWNLYVHRSYPLAVYHHIPYPEIKERIDYLLGDSRLFIYGRNSESEYYLTESNHLMLDDAVDLSIVKNPMVVPSYDSTKRPTPERRIPPTKEALIDRNDIVSGDIIVVHGGQMRGGEPAIRLGVPKMNRSYSHDIFTVQQFYSQFQLDSELLARYQVVEQFNLSNGSDELAALLLKRR